MNVPTRSRGPVLTVQICIAIIAAGGALGGGYLGAKTGESEEQFQLWSPPSLNADSEYVPIYRIHKQTGATWVHEHTRDHSANRWLAIEGGAIPPVLDEQPEPPPIDEND